jgi:hypothetical protein
MEWSGESAFLTSLSCDSTYDITTYDPGRNTKVKNVTYWEVISLLLCFAIAGEVA